MRSWNIFPLWFVLSLSLVISIVAEGASPFPGGQIQWDFRTGEYLGIPPEWEKRIFDYQVTIEGDIRPENRVAVFRQGVPADPQSQSKELIVFRIDTEAKKTSMLKSLVPDSHEGEVKAIAFTFTAAAEKLIGVPGPTLAMKTLIWVVDNSKTAKDARRTEASLKGLIALGGEILSSEEICKLEGQYYLRKGWTYRVKVGDEIRVVPLAFIYHKAR